MSAAVSPDLRVEFVAIGAAIVLTGVVFGVAIQWVRATPNWRSQWTRHARHGVLGEDNARAERVWAFAVLSAIAAVSAPIVAVVIRPVWFGVICCYDLALVSAWWLTVSLNGRRQHQ